MAINQSLNLRAGFVTAGAAVTAAAIAAGLVTVLPERPATFDIRSESAAVQLAAAVAAHLDASDAASNPLTDPPELVVVDPLVPVTGGVDPVPTLLSAAATPTTAGGGVLTSVGRAVLTVTGIVLSPLWYLAFPVTLPITIAAVNAGIPLNSGDFGVSTFMRFFGYVLGWISFPFSLASLVFPTLTTSTATPAASTRAAAAASTTAAPSTVSVLRPAAQRAHTGVTRRSAHGESVRTLPRPAAAQTAVRASKASSAAAQRDSGRATSKQRGSRASRHTAAGTD